MATIREVIDQYKNALDTGEQGKLLFGRAKKLLGTGLSDDIMDACFKEEFGYIRMAIREHDREQKMREEQCAK